MIEYLLWASSLLNLILVLIALSNASEMKHNIQLTVKDIYNEINSLQKEVNANSWKELDHQGHIRSDIYRIEAKFDEKFRELRSCKKDYNEGRPCC